MKDTEETRESGKKQGETSEERTIPLPQVSFATFVMSLNTSALVYLGEIPDVDGGESQCDLQLARHTIDTIAMLKEKTEGNLSEDEQAILDNVLFDLRMRFVKKSS